VSDDPAVRAPSLSLSGVVLDSPDPPALANFYLRLLGWEVVEEGPGWISIQAPDKGTQLSFQMQSRYRRPTWPAREGEQQMMLHLDFHVTDFGAACAHAIAIGATPAEFQPQEDVRVFTDPHGHPFCLFKR
jgi:hypothetical protein